MHLFANDRSIVIKKADKCSCAVVWDREDYIAEASKQLNDEIVYKSVKFKARILQDLAEKCNSIFKGLKEKGKITEKQLKYFTTEHKKTRNFGGSVFAFQETKNCMMFLGDQLYRIEEHQQPWNFQINSLRKLYKMGGLMLRTPTIL